MEISLIFEQLRSLWRSYWNIKDQLPIEAEALKTEIEKVTRLLRAQIAEIKKLEERNEETERLLVAALKTRAKPNNEPC